MDDDITPSSVAIIRCLQSLAEETAQLGLYQTHLRLQEAIETCRTESGAGGSIGSPYAVAKLIH